jgi:hypothetical protein
MATKPTKPSEPIMVEVSVGDNKELTAKIGDSQAKKIQEFAAFMAGTPGAPTTPTPTTAPINGGPDGKNGGSSRGGKSRRNRKSRGGKSRKGRKSLRRR